jgi:hypothetical protein
MPRTHRRARRLVVVPTLRSLEAQTGWEIANLIFAARGDPTIAVKVPADARTNLSQVGLDPGYLSLDRLRDLAGQVLAERTDRRIVEYRGGGDRERPTELAEQPVTQFDGHQ